jgi:S1-C subfamily serine protease
MSAIEKIASALVRIHVEGVSSDARSYSNWGTGLFISDDGYIVTASQRWPESVRAS